MKLSHIFLANLVYLPAAILCYLPVHKKLRFGCVRTAAVLLPALLALIAVISWLTRKYALRDNDLLFPAILISYLVYHFSLKLPPEKTLGVFAGIAALLSILTNFAACVDAARHPDSGLGTYSLTLSLLQLGFTVLAILVLAYPLITRGPFVIGQAISPVVWCAIALFSGILIASNIAVYPLEYYLFHTQQLTKNILILLAALLAIWLVQLLILYFAISSTLTLSKMKEKNQVLELQEQQFRSQQKYIKDSERARHDFRHSILTLAELYHAGNMEAVGRYLDEYLGSLPKSEVSFFCGNVALNALLNYYVHIAAMHEIAFSLQVNLPEALPLSDVDLCSIVGNILENAVTACMQADDKTIRMTILSEPHAQFYIVASNSFGGSVHRKNGDYLSTKPSGGGIGLSSVAATVENCGGTAKFTHEGNRFFSSIAIPLD